MIRLGKFFRKQLGKFLRSGPPVSETELNGSEDVDEQLNKDSGQTSVVLDELITNNSSLSHKADSGTAESKPKNQKVIECASNEEPVLRSRSKTLSKSSDISKVKSAISNQSQFQIGIQSTDEFPGIQGTKIEQSLSLAIDGQSIESNKPAKENPELNQISPQQVAGSGAQHSKDFGLVSGCANEQSYSSENKSLAKPAATGITDSVQVLPPSTQTNLVNENNRDPKRSTNAEFRISAPTDSVLRSGQLGKTLTDAGQPNDMVSRSQKVPSLPHKLSELPSNSTSLRNYLESTSVKRPSSPRHISPPKKNPAAPNRHSVSPRPSSPRSFAPAEKSATSFRGQPPRPSSSKKNVEIKDAPAHKVKEGNAESFEKNPEVLSALEEEVSLVTLVEVSDSTKEVIRNAMKRLGMKEMTTEEYWNVRWSDNGVSIQVCQKLQKYQRINRFPGSGLLMTKNNLAKNTTKMKVSYPEDYDFVPETWCLSSDISKVEQYAKTHDRDCFIVKPNDGSSGKGIIITRNIAKLKMCEKMVCQVYISKPYLIDGFKFDLRIYTLITSCKPLRLFVYNEGLARFATEQYHEPHPQNENNRYMHLTNYAVNKRSPSYMVDETKGTLRRLSTINKWLMRHNVDAKKVWESMDDAIIKTIISFLPALRHNYRVSFPEQNDSNSCFQILGFDIIFDSNLKPYVLEVNDSPSFKADVPLDKEMTESLMHDTFNILRLDENNRSKVLMEEKRQSRLRLLSSSMQNRNSIHKEKEQNERLLTQSRIDWENTHMGNYRKVYPNDQKMKHYRKFIRESQDIFINHL